MASAYDKILNPILKKYGLPDWLRPFLIEYIRSDPINAARRALSFIDVKRKKGEVTSQYVRLPNGITFKMENVVHLLSLFLYGTMEFARISEGWAQNNDRTNPGYSQHFTNVAEIQMRHARAIKNLLDGLGHKPVEPTKEIREVFSYLETLQEWGDRVVAGDMLLRYSYGVSFGMPFYKAFYPVLPEYMRTFGKAFKEGFPEIKKGEELATEIIASSEDQTHILGLSEEFLSRIVASINSEMKIAKASKITKETELLKTIAVVYPLHSLEEAGIKLDMKAELSKILKMASR